MPASSYSLDDFDMSDSSDTTKPSFRISVCLKRYFRDIRALCFVLVTRKKTVKWLERKIQKLFNVHERFYLTSRGHLLPSSERLGLLNPDDIVEVIPHETACQVFQQNEGRCCPSNNFNTIGQDMPDTGDIYKQRSGSFSECTLAAYENRDKQFVEKNNESQKGLEIAENIAQDDVILNKSLQTNVHKEIHKENDILQQVKQNALALLHSTCYGISDDLSQAADNNMASSRKRKRVRRKRQLVAASASVKSQKLCEAPTVSPQEPLTNVTEDTCSADNERDTYITDESSLTVSTFVAHNELGSVRKPRIVRSIINMS